MKKDEVIMLLVILIAVFLAAIVGFIMGSLPIQEKYKIYYENNSTIVERIQE